MTQQKPAADFRDLIVWRRGRADKARQMNIAQGSLEELRYYFLLCADLGYLGKDVDKGQADEVARILSAYTRTLLSPTS